MEALQEKLMTMDDLNQCPLGEGIDLVLGLGASGYSCARYLAGENRQMRIADSRKEPPFAQQLQDEMPQLDVRCGDFNSLLLQGVARVVTSPGIATHDELLQEAQRRQIPIVSDIELFAAAAPAPVIAITGSNGKSTVTSWIAHVLNVAGQQALSGGNLGTPALQLLDEDTPDYYVLELSSFQLERTASLRLKAAAILNIGTDHVDHHGSVQAYRDAKWRILRHAENVVMYAPLVEEARECVKQAGTDAQFWEYGETTVNKVPQYTLSNVESADEKSEPEVYLCRDGEQLIAASELKLVGHHNYLNALAVIALADACDVSWAASRQGLTTFTGLPHRMEWIGERRGITWINDSKGTNVDATVAAVRSVATPVVLIAGGDGKGADFAELASALIDTLVRVRAVVVIGVDANHIERALAGQLPVLQAASMEQAVLRAASVAQSGDTVLLSPACASFDMFDSYQHRGQTFVSAWRELV